MVAGSMYTSTSGRGFEVSNNLDRIARIWRGADFWYVTAEDREDITKIDAEMQNLYLFKQMWS